MPVVQACFYAFYTCSTLSFNLSLYFLHLFNSLPFKIFCKNFFMVYKVKIVCCYSLVNTTSVAYIRQPLCVLCVCDVCNVVKYWACSFGINSCFNRLYIKIWLQFVFPILHFCFNGSNHCFVLNSRSFFNVLFVRRFLSHCLCYGLQQCDSSPSF